MSDEPYSYTTSVKSVYSDELINTYFIRPAAGGIVRFLYKTSITPNAVTLLSILAGLNGAFFLLSPGFASALTAGILIEVKDVLDSADGQLARVKQMSSRRGRFYDSLGDILVNAMLFLALGLSMAHENHNSLYLLLAFIAFAGTTLRVSYHVFYQVSFLHLEQHYMTNRVQETITDSDRQADQVALRLQQIYQLIYGWQDGLMARIDRWCHGLPIASSSDMKADDASRWYGDRTGLVLGGLIGLGTELAVLAACVIFRRFDLYLIINIGVLNFVWIDTVIYRKFILSKNLHHERI